MWEPLVARTLMMNPSRVPFDPLRCLRTLALLALIAAIICGPLCADAQYAARVHETVLSNGLKLLVLEDHKAPVATIQIWYRVGSRNESLGRTGLSHLLEHMMFKGTQRVAPDQYARTIQINGGQSNAFTTQDYTMYFASIASDRLEVVMDLEADRMSNVVLDDAHFSPERDVVLEERRLRVDNNPVSALFEQLHAVTYTAHPYQWPTIGWMDDIRQVTVDDLSAYYRAHYIPNNAFIVVVGDVDATRFSAAAERFFGSTSAGTTPEHLRSIEPIQQGPRRVELHRDAELPFVVLAYHVPNFAHADGAALEVLETVLGGGESSRLNHELVYRRRLAREAGADYDTLSADPGLFSIFAQPLPGKPVAEIESALLGQIQAIRSSRVDQKELERAKKSIEARYVFAQDSLFNQGLWIGQYEVMGDWHRIDEYLPAIRSVSADDVLRVAQTYLDRDRQTIATLVPISESPKPSHAPTADQSRRIGG